MKTTFYAALLMLIVSVSACKRDENATAYVCISACSQCEKANQPDEELCRSNYTTDGAYQASIDDIEAQGYTCTNSSEEQETTVLLTEAQQLEQSGYECEKQSGTSRYTCVRNCFECEKGIVSFIACKEDFTTVEDYNIAFDAYEAAGYDCTFMPITTEKAHSVNERIIWEEDDYNCVIE